MGKLEFAYCPYSLVFKEPGGTSRGILKEKLTYFLRVRCAEDPTKESYGEVPIFPGLSHENVVQLENILNSLIHSDSPLDIPEIQEFSSLIFGIEQALKELNSQNDIIFPSPFTEGKSIIIINGLIWMGSFRKMKERFLEKLKAGFSCIKIKIAAINWDDELDFIRYIRETAGPDVTIRLDANGGFSVDECLGKLQQLSCFGIHSIEQPIRQGLWSEMKKVCEVSPIPIALDEELIGIPPGVERSHMLEYIRPQYIILKPALCYGFSGAQDWITRAGKLGIGYWITSALESSVGLSAIAQFTGRLEPDMPQGLGTGNLFINNFSSKLSLKGEQLYFNCNRPSYRDELKRLQWIE